MRLALTGVPGTGKTTIARALATRATVLNLNDVARDAGLLTAKDEARGSYLVDVDALAERLRLSVAPTGVTVIEGHFAHEMDVDRIALLRCEPRVLAARLRARAPAWSEAKVRENVEAEALDVLAQEVLDTGLPAREVDVTSLTVDEAAARVWHIAEAKPEALKGDPVGTARWPLESLPWF